jgi:hypothetical protein
MRDIALLAVVVLVGTLTATAVAWRPRRRPGVTLLGAFVASYLAMLAFAFTLNVCGTSHWQRGHLYLPSNCLGFLGSLVAHKSLGLLALSGLCLAGPIAVAWLRRGAYRFFAVAGRPRR